MDAKLNYAARGVLNLVWVLAILFGLQALIRVRVPETLGLALMCFAVFGAYVAGVRWIERRPVTELEVDRGVGEFATGLAVGLALFSTLMLLLWLAGFYHPASWGSAEPLAGGLLVAFLAAIVEEILFRGFLFRLIARALGTWGALAVTSVLFGAAHLANPGATVGSSLAIALEAGTLLGAAFALTQRLWMPIALHLGWNFAEGPVFGMSVSGRTVNGSLAVGTLTGPDLLTGGRFGPEASILAVLLCTATAGFILWRTVRTGRVQPPSWHVAQTPNPVD